MIPNKIIETAVIIACMAAASGHLPQLVKVIHVAQYKLLKESRGSNWGRPLLIPVKDDLAGLNWSRSYVSLGL